MSKSTVAVVIVNYNSSQDTIRSLLAANSSTCHDCNLVFFIVDNSSSDAERSYLEALHKHPVLSSSYVSCHYSHFDASRVGRYNIIFLDTNKGFSHANNSVLSLAYSSSSEFSHFLLLNSDCFVLPNTICAMLCELEKFSKHQHLRVGGVGGTLLYDDDSYIIQAAAGGSINPCIYTSRHYFYRQSLDISSPPLVHQPDFITGALFLLTREAVVAVGLFDESFFLYQEDKDYCIRLRKAGFSLIHAPQAFAIHKEGSSMSSPLFSLYYATRNQFYIIEKHARGMRRVRVLIYLALAFVNSLFKNRWPNVQFTIFHAYRDYCQGLRGQSSSLFH